jgi:hypothetical protein
MNISGVLFEDKKTIAIFGQDLDLLNKSPDIFLININDIEKANDEIIEIKDFKLGNEFIEVLLSNGTVYTCGINNKKQLGVDDSQIINNGSKLNFYKVSLPEKIIQIEVGYDNSIVISEYGKIYGWGSNYYGQICQTKQSSSNKPELINDDCIKESSLYKISTGAYHTIALYKGDINSIPDEEPIFDSCKYKLSSVLEITNPDLEKAVNILTETEQFNNEITSKKDILKEKINEIKEKCSENDLNITSSKFNLSIGTLKAIELLNKKEHLNFFDPKKYETFSDDLYIVYKIIFQLSKNDDIKNSENKKEFFEKMCKYILDNIKDDKIGDLFKDIVNNFDFCQENIFQLKNIVKGNEDKLKPKYYSKICPTTGLIIFLVKDILDYLGLNQSKKSSPAIMLANLEFLEKMKTKIPNYLKILQKYIKA